MSGRISFAEIEKGIKAKLCGDATVLALLGGVCKIYGSLAPYNVSLPVVTYSLASGGDMNETQREVVSVTYLVKVLSATMGEAGDIADAVDAALDGSTLDLAGSDSYSIMRGRAISYVELGKSRKRYVHHGAEYEFRVVEKE